MAVASQRQQHAIASTHRLTAPLRGSGHAAQAADTAWALQASCSRLASTFSCHHARPALRSAPFGALLSTESFEDRHRKPHADPCARVRDLVCVFMLGLLVQTSMLGLLAAARAVICCGSTHFKPASHGGSCLPRLVMLEPQGVSRSHFEWDVELYLVDSATAGASSSKVLGSEACRD